MVRSRGYARRELAYGLELAKTRRNFILPVKIGKCDEPRDLRKAQIDYDDTVRRGPAGRVEHAGAAVGTDNRVRGAEGG